MTKDRSLLFICAAFIIGAFFAGNLKELSVIQKTINSTNIEEVNNVDS